MGDLPYFASWWIFASLSSNIIAVLVWPPAQARIKGVLWSWSSWSTMAPTVWNTEHQTNARKLNNISNDKKNSNLGLWAWQQYWCVHLHKHVKEQCIRTSFHDEHCLLHSAGVQQLPYALWWEGFHKNKAWKQRFIIIGCEINLPSKHISEVYNHLGRPKIPILLMKIRSF